MVERIDLAPADSNILLPRLLLGLGTNRAHWRHLSWACANCPDETCTTTAATERRSI